MKSRKLFAILFLVSLNHFNGLAQDYQTLNSHFPKFYCWSENETKKKLKELGYWNEFKPGEVIADIGAYSGNVALAISLYTEGLTFYLQECQPDRLNKTGFYEMYNYYSKENGKQISNSFKFIIGNNYHSNLPDSTFDKIIMNNTFEYLMNCDLYLKELKQKLKRNGKIYITTNNPFKDDLFIKIFEANGFTCERNSSGGGMIRLVFNTSQKSTGINDVFDAVIQKDYNKTKKFLGQENSAKNRLGKAGLIQIATGISNNQAIIKLLIDKGAEINTANNHSFSFTPLSRAVAAGEYEIAKLLIENGAKPTGEDLQMAVWFGHNLPLVQLLVEKGIKIRGKENNNNTILFFAFMGGDEEIIKYLINHPDVSAAIDRDTLIKSEWKGQSPVHWAAHGYNKAVMKYLLDTKKMNVNEKDDNGMTVLMHAVYGGSIEMIKYLVEEKRVNLNEKNNFDFTALHYALDPEINKYLVSQGAK